MSREQKILLAVVIVVALAVVLLPALFLPLLRDMR
jgi:hypothetical protein